MIETDCENVSLAAMALMDGAPAPLSTEAIEQHLASCSGCRTEVAQLKALSEMLDPHERRQHRANLWPLINAQLAETANQRPPRTSGRHAFVLLGLLLLGYKLIEMIPEAELGLVFKLVPLVLVIAVFSYLKENPFKVNAGLRLEGEGK